MPRIPPISIASASPTPARYSGRSAVADEFAVFDHVDPGDDHVGQRRQRARRDEFKPRDQLPSDREQQQRKVADQEVLHGFMRPAMTRLPCALMASSFTRFQISSTFSTKNLFLKMSGRSCRTSYRQWS